MNPMNDYLFFNFLVNDLFRRILNDNVDVVMTSCHHLNTKSAIRLRSPLNGITYSGKRPVRLSFLSLFWQNSGEVNSCKAKNIIIQR